MNVVTLCMYCDNACNDGCSWSESGIPVKGWTAIKNDHTDGFTVADCPEFVHDSGRRDLNTEGCQNLVAAIVKTLVVDYLKSSPKMSATRTSIEKFISGEFFGAVSSIDPDLLIELIRKKWRLKWQK